MKDDKNENGKGRGTVGQSERAEEAGAGENREDAPRMGQAAG